MHLILSRMYSGFIPRYTEGKHHVFGNTFNLNYVLIKEMWLNLLRGLYHRVGACTILFQ